jgi:hypothetical protein
MKLYQELQKTFSNHSKGTLVKEILYGNSFEKKVIPLKQSVYGKWKVTDGFLLGRKKAADSPLALSPLIRVKEEVIGVDKLEHLFGMGFNYFNQHYLKNKPLLKVLKGGIFKEKTVLGGNRLATGVFSYGDLSANFNGMRFWNHILQLRSDVLGESQNLGPYVVCRENKWEVNKEKLIDFSKYVDASFDESINCSKFAAKAAIKRFNQMAFDQNNLTEIKNIQCPKDQSRLDELNKKYSPLISEDPKDLSIGHWIINNEGHGKVSYFNEF